MRRTIVAGTSVLLIALGAGFWLARDRGPSVADPDQALPWNEKVEIHFPADEHGEADTWVVTKKETTREESLGASAQLPEPDPADRDRSVDESARVLNDHARDAWRSGNIEAALDLYAKAVAADPDDWVPQAHYGRLLAITRDDATARPVLERAASLSPDDPQRWLDLQTLYERAQQLELAFEARKRAEALAGGRAITQDWAGFYTLEGSEELP